MSRERKYKEVPEVEFANTLPGFLKKLILNAFVTSFLEYERAIRLSVDKKDHLKAKDLINNIDQYYYLKTSLESVLHRLGFLSEQSTITTFDQLKNQQTPGFKELLGSLENAKDQIGAALAENNFQDALAYYFYYKENLKKIEESNSIRSEMNLLLASIHQSYAEFIEEHEKNKHKRYYL